MSDQTRGLHILRKLKAMGISVAMDDFGTGYSSLATLHAFPFDKIKLDQSFVKRLPDDAAAAAIVRTVLALGESLGIPVLAEGIETEAQWHFLAREGCAKGQGYLFAKPGRLAQLPAAIEAAARFVREDEPVFVEAPRVAAADEFAYKPPSLRGAKRRRSSVRREAIEQAVAAGALEVGLRAAAVRAARGMRGVPGFRRSSSRSPTRSAWPTIAAPCVLLVQFLQVRSSPAANAVPSACDPVSTSWRFGVSPRPLMTSPFSLSAVCLVRLLAALAVRRHPWRPRRPWSSARVPCRSGRAH